MPERAIANTPANAGDQSLTLGNNKIKEAVCIHTQKIYDACRERVCAGYRSVAHQRHSTICNSGNAPQPLPFGLL